MLKKILIVATTMLILDGVWLGLAGQRFYFEKLKHLARGTDTFEVNYPAAALVYVFLVILFLVFLAPVLPERSWLGAIFSAFIFGFLIYGIYDFTNLATLKDWPILVSAVDMVWGGVLCAITAGVFKFCVELGWILP
jgi:uncharacterized membrane protein